MAGKKCDLAFLCNPNNPTGRVMSGNDVLAIAEAARELQCHLVVDEALIDFCSAGSVISEVVRNPYLIVLRSLTKYYALAGLRVGFGVFPRRLADALRDRKEPWSMNNLAQAAGSVVLSDVAYHAATHSLIRREKRYLEAAFTRLSLAYVPSDANYYLLHLERAGALMARLAKHGIYLRDCSNFHGLGRGDVRIAVRLRRENVRLIGELARSCAAS